MKPDNIVIDEDGYCVLIDFGLSIMGMGENDTTRSLLGTIGYIPPEMVLRL